MTAEFLDIAARALVILGAILLAFSLRPARSIYLHAVTGRGWKILFYLIMFFIAGYLAFAVLVTAPFSFTQFIVAAVFFGGSCFVTIVVRMGLSTIRRMSSMASDEHYRAMHDELTELPNRVLFTERVEQAIEATRGTSKHLAVFIMDLDRFKEVNDTLGHFHGDQLLKQVAPRLRDALHNKELVARLGGDEFGVLLHSIDDLRAATVMAQRILHSLEEGFWVEGYHLDISISIGIAFFPEHGQSGDQLLQKADVAMYLAKHRNEGYMIYDPSQDLHTVNRLALMGDLRHAIDNQNLELYYQPQVDIATGQVASVEALLRWNHPERGLIACNEFITLAEQTGMIKPLTQWVLYAVLRQSARWRSAGIDLTIALNLSVKNFHEPQLVQNIQHGLEQWNVDAGRLRLEIVESAMMQDPLHVRSIIERLNAAGVLFSIDDFGTGYSSLSHLKQLPADEIKIDQSFVTGMANDEDSAVIVRAIIDLAHNLGCDVVAEGVESQDILDLLVILGCDRVQGHYISPPLPPDQLIAWLGSGTRHLPKAAVGNTNG